MRPKIVCESTELAKCGAAQQGFQPTLKAARFVAFMGCVGLGAAEAVVVAFLLSSPSR
jgi:hypothetical protein